MSLAADARRGGAQSRFPLGHATKADGGTKINKNQSMGGASESGDGGASPLKGAPPTDASLAAKRRFLDELYRAHWNNLVGWLRRRYGAGPPAPEDIAQAAFAKLAAHDNLERIEHSKSYLYATAVHAALDEFHWRKRTDRFVEHELNRAGQPLEEITPERVYLDREQWDLMGRALETLSEKQQEIVRRSRFLGQTYAQISAETGWSSPDISRQLTAAMLALQAALGRTSADAPAGGGGKTTETSPTRKLAERK